MKRLSTRTDVTLTGRSLGFRLYSCRGNQQCQVKHLSSESWSCHGSSSAFSPWPQRMTSAPWTSCGALARFLRSIDKGTGKRGGRGRESPELWLQLQTARDIACMIQNLWETAAARHPKVHACAHAPAQIGSMLVAGMLS